MKKVTLLEKAKNISYKYNDYKHRDATYEETEVVVAFLMGEIGWGQLCTVVKGIGGKSSINYGRISKIIKDGCRKGWIKIKIIKNLKVK